MTGCVSKARVAVVCLAIMALTKQLCFPFLRIKGLRSTEIYESFELMSGFPPQVTLSFNL